MEKINSKIKYLSNTNSWNFNLSLTVLYINVCNVCYQVKYFSNLFSQLIVCLQAYIQCHLYVTNKKSKINYRISTEVIYVCQSLFLLNHYVHYDIIISLKKIENIKTIKPFDKSRSQVWSVPETTWWLVFPCKEWYITGSCQKLLSHDVITYREVWATTVWMLSNRTIFIMWLLTERRGTTVCRLLEVIILYSHGVSFHRETWNNTELIDTCCAQ